MKQRRSLLNHLSQQRTHTLTSWYATHSSPRSIWDTSYLFPKVAGDNSVPLSPISSSLIIKSPEYKRLSQVRLYTHCLQSFTASQCGKNNLQGRIKESHFQMLQWHNRLVCGTYRSHFFKALQLRHEDRQRNSIHVCRLSVYSLCSVPCCLPGSSTVPFTERALNTER